jgi:hypothetical protein
MLECASCGQVSQGLQTFEGVGTRKGAGTLGTQPLGAMKERSASGSRAPHSQPRKARTASCLPPLISHPPAPRRRVLSCRGSLLSQCVQLLLTPRSKRFSLLQPPTTPRYCCPLGSSFTPCKSAQQTVPPCDLRVLCLYHHHARSHHRTLTLPSTRLTSPSPVLGCPLRLLTALLAKASLTGRPAAG